MADIRNLSDQLINKTIEVDHKTRIQDSYLLLNVLLSQSVSKIVCSTTHFVWYEKCRV